MTKQESKSANSNSGLRNNIYYLGLTSLLNDIASEMITPILPIFLTSVLGASGLAVGLVEGSAKAAEQLLSIFSGWYSDRIRKRKPLVVLGYLVTTLSKGLFAFTTSWPQFLVVRFAERSGKAIRTPPRDAILARSVKVNERRAGFAIHRVLDTGGAIVGPLLAILLLSQLGNDIGSAARSIFLIALVPGLIAVGIAVFLVKEPPILKGDGSNRRKLEIFNIAKYGPGFRTLLLSFVIFSLFAPTLAFFYLKASAVGFDLSGVLLLALLFSIAYIFGAGALSVISKVRKIGERQGVILGLLGLLLVFLIVSGVGSFEQFAVVFGAYGFFVGLLDVETKVYIASLVKKELLAGAYGTYQTSTGIAMLGSGVIFGLLWDLSPAYAFQVAAVGAMIGLGLFIVKGNPRKIR